MLISLQLLFFCYLFWSFLHLPSFEIFSPLLQMPFLLFSHTLQLFLHALSTHCTHSVASSTSPHHSSLLSQLCCSLPFPSWHHQVQSKMAEFFIPQKLPCSLCSSKRKQFDEVLDTRHRASMIFHPSCLFKHPLVLFQLHTQVIIFST